MPSTPYMKLYVGDYLGDTSHLNTLQHGAYLLLIMAYWQKGGYVRNTDVILQTITRTTPEQWAECKEAILEFFEDRDGFLFHKRIDKELQKREAVSNKCRGAIAKRWENEHTDVLPTYYGRNTTPIVHSPDIKSRERVRFQRPTIEEIGVYCEERKNGISPQRFYDYYEANGWKVGRNSMKDWKAAVRTWERNDGKFTSVPSVKPEPKPTDVNADMLDMVNRHYAELEGRDGGA